MSSRSIWGKKACADYVQGKPGGENSGGKVEFEGEEQMLEFPLIYRRIMEPHVEVDLEERELEREISEYRH